MLSTRAPRTRRCVAERACRLAMPLELPEFSVIIPTYNRPTRLTSCLRAFAKLEYPADRFEVVVVDDGSPDPIEPVVAAIGSALRVRVVRQMNAGPAAARNTGAAQASGEFLAFTDDDCVPHRDWLRTFGEHLKADPASMLGGRTINALPENPYSEASQLLISYLYDYFNTGSDRASFFASNNMAMPADQFNDIGGFDSSLPLAAGEDRDFCDRWLHAGYPVRYVPDAAIYHAHEMSLPSYWRQHFTYGRGAALFHRLRAERYQVGIRPEPLAFYTNLVRYPFLDERGLRTWLQAALLLLSQVANAQGFLWESLRRITRAWGSGPEEST